MSFLKQPVTTINSYNIIGYTHIDLFYDQLEMNLCDSIFPRNVWAMRELFTGEFGILTDHCSTNIYHIHISKSKVLSPQVREILEECKKYNSENGIQIFIMFE